MLPSTDDLEWVASVLLCLVLLTGLHRLLPHDDVAPPRQNTVIAARPSASLKQAGREANSLMSDLQLHD
jgi:hypothetical protein